jgi:hypothetical protein
MADNKTKPTKVSVASFIEALADETRREDAKVLVKLMQSATGENARMWDSSIIGFGSYIRTRAAARATCRLPVFHPVRPQLLSMAWRSAIPRRCV